MQRRLVIAGLAATLAAPVAVIEPAAAAILFTCDSVTGSGTVSPGLVHDRRAQSMSSGPTAPAGPADLALASTSDLGVTGNNSSYGASLSADGALVAFTSIATNLDPLDNDMADDVYVKNLVTGDLRLVSTNAVGVKANSFTNSAALSADGTKVVFQSRATNLVAADTDLFSDIYVKDLATGALTLASSNALGVKGNSYSYSPSISADGNLVVFYTEANNLDPADSDTKYDVYAKNIATGALTLVSTNDLGVKGNEQSDFGVISADGGRVAFSSWATNFDPQVTSYEGQTYVKDLATGDLLLASTNVQGIKADDWTIGPASLSADGTSAAFTSRAENLDARVGGTVDNVFVKDLTTGALTLASVSDTGTPGDRNSNIPSLSANGTKVAFQSDSSAGLDPADSNGEEDVFVKDLATGDLTLAATSDTGVQGDNRNRGPFLIADGAYLAFHSNSSNLDPADTSTGIDVYVKALPASPTSIAIGECSNGQSGTVSVVELGSYGARPLGCPESLGGATGNDYPDQTPLLLGSNPSLRIDWASGPDSFGVAKLKMGTTSTQWRAVLAIQASPDHNTPATNQYLPASGSGFTKTKLKGRIDWSALDSFNCTSGTGDPISWLDLVNNGSWIVKNQ